MTAVRASDEVHRQAWERIAAAAPTDRQAAYGIYAVRTVAVRHPEIYLMADGWFADGARSISGFMECYEEPTALGWCHMEYGGAFFRQEETYRGIPTGRPLRLQDIAIQEYRPAADECILPGARLSFVDRRLAPLAVALKTEGKVVTPLELAAISYFARRERRGEATRLFIVLCDTGSAYLIEDAALFDAASGVPAITVHGTPILVWNEHSVLYPLMERDDRGADKQLARAVSRLKLDVGAPSLNPFEETLVRRLRDATALDSEPQHLMAGLASVRAGGWRFHPYGDIWRRFIPAADLDVDISRRLGIVREFNLWADRVSPAVAHLWNVLPCSATPIERLRVLSREYLVHTGVVRDAEARGWKPAWRTESWGHLWPCGLMEHTIDDAFRSRTGHCVSQAHMISAVLELMGIPHIVVNFNRGGVRDDVNHHFVLSQDGTFLFDDGILNVRGADADTEDYGPLLSFSGDGEWAATSGDHLYGNISSSRLTEYIELIDRSLDKRFELTFFRSLEAQDIVSKEEFVSLLRSRDVERIALP